MPRDRDRVGDADVRVVERRHGRADHGAQPQHSGRAPRGHGHGGRSPLLEPENRGQRDHHVRNVTDHGDRADQRCRRVVVRHDAAGHHEQHVPVRLPRGDILESVVRPAPGWHAAAYRGHVAGH